jgi:ligand-binding sensor domain-containing protein
MNAKRLLLGTLIGAVLLGTGIWVLRWRGTPKTEVVEPKNEAPPSDVQFFDIGPRRIKALLPDGPFLWVGTSDGVVKYDPRKDDFEVFNNQNSGLLSNGIFFLGRLDDRLWVGTYGGGLSIYDGQSWLNYNIPQGLADPFVYGAAKAPNGDIWLATWSGANQIAGGKLDDPKAWTTHTVESTGGGLPNKWVYAIAIDPDGAVWFGTEGGLALYRDGKWRHWSHQEGLGAAYEIVKDALSKEIDPATVSKHHSQDRIDQGLGAIHAPFNPNYIVSMLLDSKGRVWCGTWGGGLSVLEDGEFVRTYTTRDGLTGNYVSLLAQGPDGSIWAGGQNGLSHLEERGSTIRFVNYSKRNGYYRDSILAVAFPEDHSTWLAGAGGAVRFLKGLE